MTLRRAAGLSMNGICATRSVGQTLAHCQDNSASEDDWTGT